MTAQGNNGITLRLGYDQCRVLKQILQAAKTLSFVGSQAAENNESVWTRESGFRGSDRERVTMWIRPSRCLGLEVFLEFGSPGYAAMRAFFTLEGEGDGEYLGDRKWDSVADPFGFFRHLARRKADHDFALTYYPHSQEWEGVRIFPEADPDDSFLGARESEPVGRLDPDAMKYINSAAVRAIGKGVSPWDTKRNMVQLHESDRRLWWYRAGNAMMVRRDLGACEQGYGGLGLCAWSFAFRMAHLWSRFDSSLLTVGMSATSALEFGEDDGKNYVWSRTRDVTTVSRNFPDMYDRFEPEVDAHSVLIGGFNWAEFRDVVKEQLAQFRKTREYREDRMYAICSFCEDAGSRSIRFRFFANRVEVASLEYPVLVYGERPHDIAFDLGQVFFPALRMVAKRGAYTLSFGGASSSTSAVCLGIPRGLHPGGRVIVMPVMPQAVCWDFAQECSERARDELVK